ncbi:MAG: dockerin type I domain-containing protein [Ruminococcus flavefaciens]|nr:dockerin type I domain-containing protein [Ruminococcus flavefaciens]
MDGEWEWYGKKYDKCIPTFDTNMLTEDKETLKVVSYGCCEDISLFINSETKEVCVPLYFDPEQKPSMVCGEDFKVFTLDDDDFMNYMGKINPSYSYSTEFSDLNSITIKNDNECTIDVTDSNNMTYDGIAECKTVFPNNGDEYVLQGKDFKVHNTADAENFGVNFLDINHAVNTDFQGAVNDIFFNADEFSFDVSAPTEYDVSLVFEEGSYDFSPHYRIDLSGSTGSGFKAVQTDRGVILSSPDGLKCQIKINDIIRDENGLVSVVYANIDESSPLSLSAFPEEKVQTEAICTAGDVLLTFAEDGSLSYYIGDNYDTEVQKGDVNCDGLIDAVDATQILMAYSKNSTDSTGYVGKTLGDYNGDGLVDAVDATQILMEYAELSTK